MPSPLGGAGTGTEGSWEPSTRKVKDMNTFTMTRPDGSRETFAVDPANPLSGELISLGVVYPNGDVRSESTHNPSFERPGLAVERRSGGSGVSIGARVVQGGTEAVKDMEFEVLEVVGDELFEEGE